MTKITYPADYSGFAHEASDPKMIKKYAKQRRERGFDVTELWNLDNTFAKYIASRIKVFREINHGHPGRITEDEWLAILDRIVEGFEVYTSEDFDYGENRVLNHKKFEDAKLLFVEYFENFWD